MDIKVLSLGEVGFNHGISENLMDHNILLSSNFYFDWIELKSVSQLANPLAKMFDFEGFDKVRNTFGDSLHLQDSLLLISDEEDKLFDPVTGSVYVSLINLSLWNETIVDNSEIYVGLRKKVSDSIKFIMKEKVARLYNAFEYCDFVLICDASDTSLGEYTRLIKEIREMTVHAGMNQLKAIHDIITIYGYNKKSAESIYDNETVCVTAGLTFETNDSLVNLTKSFIDEGVSAQMTSSSETLGQYDYIFTWDKITHSTFNKLVKILENSRSDFLSLRVYVGIPKIQFDNEEMCKRACVSKKKGDKSELLKQFCKVDYSFLLDMPFGNTFYMAIHGIQHMIKTLVSKGIAQYYVLTFCESFYSFISFLKRVKDEYKQDSVADCDINHNKMVIEKIEDMFRVYFGFLNALNECTSHSRKHFLMMSPYQMLYFDAPPKFIAFYTAMANKIVRAVNESRDEYTFLITPDFKKDIFVDSLTEDRTMGSEHNILIIHMSEAGMYNIVDTLKIVAHEIFHHIGQNMSMRIKRAHAFVKCCLFRLIIEAFDLEEKAGISAGKRMNIFELFTENLFQELFGNDELLFPNAWFEAKEYSFKREECIYYLEYLTEVLDDYLYYIFRKQDRFMIDRVIKRVIEAGYDITEHPYWKIDPTGKDVEVSRMFSLRYLSAMALARLTNYLLYNNLESTYPVVKYVFRECHADARMLMLVSKTEERINIYEDTLSSVQKGMKLTYEDDIRVQTIYKHFAVSEQDKAITKLYEDKTISWNETNSKEENEKEKEGLFHLYLRNQVEEYLKFIDEPTSVLYNETKKGIMQLFNHYQNDNVKGVMTMIEKEIFDYRKYLTKKENL